MAPSAEADEARRVGASYTLGRLAAITKDTNAMAQTIGHISPVAATQQQAQALGALMQALRQPGGSGGDEPQQGGEAARRVSVCGLVAAGAAAVPALCKTLLTEKNERVLMYAADAMADAAPVGSQAALASLHIVIKRLEAMVESSPRLAAWKAAKEAGDKSGSFGGGREQWHFAEDTALLSCQTAVERIANPSTSM